MHRVWWRSSPLRKVRACRRFAHDGNESVRLAGVVAADGSVSSLGVGGMQTCGTWHSCMGGCSAKVGHKRADELDHALRVWDALGGTVVLATFSLRHRQGQRLRDLIEAQREGRKAVTSDRPWNAERDELGIRFVLWAFEATHGDEHGWHPHYHVFLLCDPRAWTTTRVPWGKKGKTREKLVSPVGDPIPVPQRHAEDVLAGAWSRWEQGIARKGMTAISYVYREGVRESAGFDVSVMDRDARESYARYPYKLALEAVGAMWKRGREDDGKRHRTPFEIMTDHAVALVEERTAAAEVDREIVAEWSQTMTDLRVRQCAWPPGMRAWFAEKATELGIDGPLLEDEQTDEEIAAEETPEAETIGHIRPGEWREVIAYELDTLRRAGRTAGIPGIVAWFEVRGLSLEQPRDDRRTELGDQRDHGGDPPGTGT